MNAPTLNLPYRPATQQDAAAMAQLINLAGEGMPLYLWSSMATDGQSPWSIGEQRAKRESGGFSYRNTFVSESQGAVVAALIGYPLSDRPDPARYDDLPPMFVPLQQLEDKVPGTWYVNVLAAFPEHRGRGYGTGLLGLAEELAAQHDCSGLSLIVSDANKGGRRLYDRCGYREVAKRPMVKEGWENEGEHWILLEKPL